MESNGLNPEASDASDPAAAPDGSSVKSHEASRRRFVLTGLIGVPIILTLTSRSAWSVEESGGASAGYGGGGGGAGGTPQTLPQNDPFYEEGQSNQTPDEFGR